MAPTAYKVWTWGDPVGIGATGSMHLGIAGIAKGSDDHNPFIVANEFICAGLAHALRLPCPPGAIVDKAGRPFYFSLNFNLAGMALPPADPKAITEQDPRLAWGIVLFDVWTSNCDRHQGNIAHDTATKKVQIFDHSHAFVGPGKPDVTAKLKADENALAIGGNCLANAMQDWDGMELWTGRIKMVPEYVIDQIVLDATEIGLPSDARQFCSDHLKARREKISALVEASPGNFPHLPKA